MCGAETGSGDGVRLKEEGKCVWGFVGLGVVGGAVYDLCGQTCGWTRRVGKMSGHHAQSSGAFHSGPLKKVIIIDVTDPSTRHVLKFGLRCLCTIVHIKV